MWKLISSDGSLFRDGFNNQWEALITGFHEDGSRYKKVEALAVESGTEVYKKQFVSVVEKHRSFCTNGEEGGAYIRKASAPRLQKYVLIEY